ncbi:RNA polymerase sigma factor [Rothia sp. HC945]|uniref:RNA polymerase sigma factor n=1 Tax=Rothia sp. HC945 TaxID=3171170 RepID=UPI003F52259F
MNQKIPFETIVRHHGPTVWRVCRAVLGPGQDAEDAWAETFVAALTVWEGLPPDTNVEAWLVRVARNKAVDVVRSSARRAVPTASPPETAWEDDAVSRAGVDPADAAVTREREDMLWGAVDALPERQRLAVAYHHLGGLPHDEVADIIGGTPAAVRRASSDGMRALGRRLGVSGQEDDPHDLDANTGGTS